MKLNLSLLVLIALAFAASLLAGRVWLPPDKERVPVPSRRLSPRMIRTRLQTRPKRQE